MDDPTLPAGPVPAATLTDAPLLREQVDALIGQRLSRLQLPASLHALFDMRAAERRRRVLSSWCNWVAGFGLISLFTGWVSLPAGRIGFGLGNSVVVTLAFLATSQIIRRRIMDRWRDIVISLPVALTLVLSLASGYSSGQATTFLIYMIMSIALAWSAITYLEIRYTVTLGIAGFATICLAGFTMISALSGLPEKLLLLLFLSVTTAGMVNARRVQNLYAARLFLLQLRDELRSSEMADLNASLAKLANTDRLTKLANRRFFDERIAAMQASPLLHLPLAACLIDIDHFKLLNDRLGHLEGDRCLQMVAATLRDNLRAASDFVARYGGEEFVLILTKTDAQAALQSVERLRAAVRALACRNPATEIGYVTISAGLAFASGTGFDATALLEQADRALYRAKSAGRNRVCG
jgi:diguanylate cyclase (GGDEF)-like protein